MAPKTERCEHLLWWWTTWPTTFRWHLYMRWATVPKFISLRCPLSVFRARNKKCDSNEAEHYVRARGLRLPDAVQLSSKACFLVKFDNTPSNKVHAYSMRSLKTAIAIIGILRTPTRSARFVYRPAQANYFFFFFFHEQSALPSSVAATAHFMTGWNQGNGAAGKRRQTARHSWHNCVQASCRFKGVYIALDSFFVRS